MKRILPTVAVFGLVLVSCTQNKDFTIRTLPEGAKISINGKDQGEHSPLTVSIDQGKDLGITAFKPGYEVASATVETKTSFWRSLLWNKHDPRARYIEEDEITIPLKRIASSRDFAPTRLPAYKPPFKNRSATGSAGSSAPALRPMPSF